MNNIMTRTERPGDLGAIIPRFSRMSVTRTLVETGDERCPIAGIWSRLEADVTADDAELTRRAMWMLFLWRALSSRLHIPALQ